jgi:hypothetical protein
MDFELGRFGVDPPALEPIREYLVAVDPLMACGGGPLRNADQVKGKVAFIIRGECDFIEKAMTAQNAGAVAVIVGNHDEERAMNADDLIIMDPGDHPDTDKVRSFVGWWLLVVRLAVYFCVLHPSEVE